MSNFMRKFKFGLRSRLGLIPGTSRIEAQDMELRKEYEEFIRYEESKEPQRFEELEELVTSQDFRDRRKYIQRQRFKDSDAYSKLMDYNAMKKSSLFKAYFRFVSSKFFPDFKKFDDSDEIKKLEAAGEDKEGEYSTLRKSPGIKAYYKISKSKDLEAFRKLHDSPEMEKFNELESYVNSNEFRETKKHLESRDKFKKTPEYKQLTEYQELKKSKKLKWYYKCKESGKFDELKKWKLVFSDDFDKEELDKSKWLTSFYWGKQLLKESYSLASDLHYYTDGKNHEVNNSMLKLHTRKENVTGQAWDRELGFFPKEFEYTSGLINTGESFRQQYGAFEAKVRMHRSNPVYHAFWMLSDKMVPQIDIFRFSGKRKRRIEFNTYREESGRKDIRINSGNIGGIDFSKGFFIYRFEWYPDRMVWKINNTVVKISHEGIPNEPMYILFSSGVESNASGNGLPTTMDIDWVRCFRYDSDKKS